MLSNSCKEILENLSEVGSIIWYKNNHPASLCLYLQNREASVDLWGFEEKLALRRRHCILLCRHPLFYCALIYCASPVVCFSQIEGLRQPCVEQFYCCHFSNSICSLRVSVSRFGNSYNISNLFIIIIYVMVICDLWCYFCNCFFLFVLYF